MISFNQAPEAYKNQIQTKFFINTIISILIEYLKDLIQNCWDDITEIATINEYNELLSSVKKFPVNI